MSQIDLPGVRRPQNFCLKLNLFALRKIFFNQRLGLKSFGGGVVAAAAAVANATATITANADVAMSAMASGSAVATASVAAAMNATAAIATSAAAKLYGEATLHRL